MAPSPLTSFHLFCISLEGIPLYSQRSEDLPAVPFPIIGSVNGAHMYAHNSNVKLLSATTEDGRFIIWKVYDKVKFILVLHNESEFNQEYAEITLDNIVNCMIMVIGKSEFTTIKNVEKLKRKFRTTGPLLKTIMKKTSLLCGVTQCIDLCLCTESTVVQNQLNLFVNDCDAEVAIVLLNGKVVVASENFWLLDIVDSCTLLQFVQSQASEVTASDMPIYLPVGSPNVAHRLVVMSPFERLKIAVICGEQPSFSDYLGKYVNKYWLPLTHTLKQLCQSSSRSFPPHIKLHSNVLAFLLIAHQSSWSSFYPHGTTTAADHKHLSSFQHRCDALVNFYDTCCRTVEQERKEGVEAKEWYECYSDYKCCAVINSTSPDLYVLFTSDVPTFALASLTHTLLQRLLKENVL